MHERIKTSMHQAVSMSSTRRHWHFHILIFYPEWILSQLNVECLLEIFHGHFAAPHLNFFSIHILCDEDPSQSFIPILPKHELICDFNDNGVVAAIVVRCCSPSFICRSNKLLVSRSFSPHFLAGGRKSLAHRSLNTRIHEPTCGHSMSLLSFVASSFVGKFMIERTA